MFRYAAEAAREDLDEADRAVLDHLERWLGGQPARAAARSLRRLRGELLARFQQLSSPTAAKAVEDTACYRSAALLSRNDVGFDPHASPLPPRNSMPPAKPGAWPARAPCWPPPAMTTSAARTPAPVLRRSVNWRPGSRVTSSTGKAWPRRCAATSPRAGAESRRRADPVPGPARQLAARRALRRRRPGPSVPRADARNGNAKALREAKLRTRWTAPDEDYERACADYLEQLLRAPLAQACASRWATRRRD